MRTERQRAGDSAEEVVATRLAAQGWTLVARNLRVGRGELDILAVDPGPPSFLVIIEVRWRADRSHGLPEETLDWRKRGQLRRAAFGLVERGLPGGRSLPHLPLRFDLVVVEPGAQTNGPPVVRHHRHVIGG